MRWLNTALVVATFVAAPAAYAAEASSLDGTWEGVVHFGEASFHNVPDAKPADARLRLVIHGPVVDASIDAEGTHFDIRPGALHISQVNSNAIVFGSNFEGDENGGWTESWSFVLTRTDGKRAFVEYSRLVNNSGHANESDNTKFGAQGMGELTWVEP